MKLRTRLAWLAAATLLACCPQTLAQDIDRWYELWMTGARSGWSRETVTTEGDRVTSTTEMHLEIGRADEAVEISSRSTFVETADGRLLEVRFRHDYGSSPVSTTYEIREGDVLVRTIEGDREREQTQPLPAGEWLSPRAAAEYLRRRLSSGAKEITVRTLDAQGGLTVVTTTRTGIEPAEVQSPRGAVEGYRASTVTQTGPTKIASSEWLDSEGTLLRSETKLGELEMLMVASTRERALAPVVPAEMLVSTFVKPDRRIAGARTRTKGVYRVSIASGELAPLPGSAFQRAERLDERAALVRVDTSSREPAGEVDRESHLAATSYLDADHELIRGLTARALDGVSGDDAAARSEALRRFVYRHIARKDLGVAFATASQTARSAEGDCSEHAVLLAAMLRAAGIPSRVVAGVVYVDEFAGERGVFGYHMWTQALLESEAGPAWIDLDPTLAEATPFDATHIAFATSPMAEGDAVGSLAALAPLLGSLQISVEEVE